MKPYLTLPLLAVLCGGLPVVAAAADVSGAIGVTGQGDMTYRASLGLDWDKQWLQSETGHLGGYWDAGYTYWDGGDYYSAAHSLSLSPVFVYEFANLPYQPFVEFGIGVAFFSKTDVGEHQLGSSFNFEDRIGVGMSLSETRKLGLRALHYSNGGIKTPNDGIESYSLYYGQSF